MPRWWMNIVTGPDNLTVSIGRVLSLVLFVNMLLVLPMVVTGVAIVQKIRFADIVAALPQISGYVVSVGITIAGMIGLTNHTEPRP